MATDINTLQELSTKLDKKIKHALAAKQVGEIEKGGMILNEAYLIYNRFMVHLPQSADPKQKAEVREKYDRIKELRQSFQNEIESQKQKVESKAKADTDVDVDVEAEVGGEEALLFFPDEVVVSPKEIERGPEAALGLGDTNEITTGHKQATKPPDWGNHVAGFINKIRELKTEVSEQCKNDLEELAHEVENGLNKFRSDAMNAGKPGKPGDLVETIANAIIDFQNKLEPKIFDKIADFFITMVNSIRKALSSPKNKYEPIRLFKQEKDELKEIVQQFKEQIKPEPDSSHTPEI
jgi:hypothetical protein